MAQEVHGTERLTPLLTLLKSLCPLFSDFCIHDDQAAQMLKRKLGCISTLNFSIVYEILKMCADH